MILDPFGERAKEIISEFGGIEGMMDVIPDYVSIDDALARISWKDSIPDRVINMGDVEDILSFYALLGALSLKPYGLELEVVKRKNMNVYLRRIEIAGRFDSAIGMGIVKEGEIPKRDLFILERRGIRGLPSEELDRIRISYRLHLSDFLRFWDGTLRDVYIRGGYAYVSRVQAFKVWRGYFGKKLSDVLASLRVIDSDFYSRLNNELSALMRRISCKPPHENRRAEAGPLRFDLFPPCIKRALAGVPSGMRNYAITVLLTSFLSYARFCPSPPRRNVRLKDCVDDVRAIKDEVVSVIVEAGNRCNPPLFDDQPNELKNVWYHLGFGFTEEPSLEDSGNSVWYFPPNCDKVRANVPQLCVPDEFCKGVKNPLSYYVRRLGRKKRGGGMKRE